MFNLNFMYYSFAYRFLRLIKMQLTKKLRKLIEIYLERTTQTRVETKQSSKKLMQPMKFYLILKSGKSTTSMGLMESQTNLLDTLMTICLVCSSAAAAAEPNLVRAPM